MLQEENKMLQEKLFKKKLQEENKMLQEKLKIARKIANCKKKTRCCKKNYLKLTKIARRKQDVARKTIQI